MNFKFFVEFEEVIGNGIGFLEIEFEKGRIVGFFVIFFV